MKPPWIDFIHQVTPGQQLLRAVLLVLGGLALALALFRQHQVSAEQTALTWRQQNLARLESRQLPMLHTAMHGDASGEADKRANEVLHLLNLPWDPLFTALEHAVTPGIHVLSVTPDPHKGSVTLKATAPDNGAALDFIDRLQAGKNLRNAHLVTQEIMVDSKHHPLLFTVTAEWKETP